MKVIKWLFWNIAYIGRRPKDLGAFLVKMERTSWPWRRFKPNVFHNDDGHQWEIYLTDQGSYTVSGVPLRADVMFDHDTNAVVGMTIYDETLRMISERQQALMG